MKASPPSAVRRAARAAAAGRLLAVLLGTAANVGTGLSASAQLVPLPMPPPPRPPFPTGGVQRALGGAFGAISAITATNPATAQQANFLYQSALERYRAHDFAAAAAEANAARAIAGGAAVTPATLAPLQPGADAQTAPVPGSAPGYPATGAGTGQPGYPTTATNHPREQILTPPILPDDLLRAREEIELGAELDGPLLEQAKAHYRAALDAYMSGDRKKEQREAGASFAQAEQVLEHPAKP